MDPFEKAKTILCTARHRKHPKNLECSKCKISSSLIRPLQNLYKMQRDMKGALVCQVKGVFSALFAKQLHIRPYCTYTTTYLPLKKYPLIIQKQRTKEMPGLKYNFSSCLSACTHVWYFNWFQDILRSGHWSVHVASLLLSQLSEKVGVTEHMATVTEWNSLHRVQLPLWLGMGLSIFYRNHEPFAILLC